MLMRKGMGVVGGGVVPAVQADSGSADYSLPWQCGWLPFYSSLHPDVCPSSVVQKAMTPKPPAAPVAPAGSLDLDQTPGGYYSVDQVISDTAAVQRQQTRDFFSQLSDQLGLKDSSDAGFPWGVVALVALVGGGVFLLGRRSS